MLPLDVLHLPWESQSRRQQLARVTAVGEQLEAAVAHCPLTYLDRFWAVGLARPSGTLECLECAIRALESCVATAAALACFLPLLYTLWRRKNQMQ